MTIYIVVKAYIGGKMEVKGAYYTEDEAKKKVCQCININEANSLISIWTTELEDS